MKTEKAGLSPLFPWKRSNAAAADTGSTVSIVDEFKVVKALVAEESGERGTRTPSTSRQTRPVSAAGVHPNASLSHLSASPLASDTIASKK